MSTPGEQISGLMPLPNQLSGSERLPVSQNNGSGYTTYYGTPTQLGITVPRTAAEIAVGVTPVNLTYVPGCPDRFATNTTPGTTDMTAAVLAAYNSSTVYTGTHGAVYGVTSLVFAAGSCTTINFNGSQLRGIASSPTPCIVQFEQANANVYGWNIDGHFNQNYQCGTWWYNATLSSQYNAFFGMEHSALGGTQSGGSGANSQVRALIYGALPGNTSTNFAQSENQVYGWRTVGCLNPLYVNHNQGYLNFANPMFVTDTEGWGSYIYTGYEMAIEQVVGSIFFQGGEVEAAESGTPAFACKLTNAYMIGVNFECASTLGVVGDGVQIIASHMLINPGIPAFTVASGVTGKLLLQETLIGRGASVGTYDNTSMIVATAAGAGYQVILENCISQEWRWLNVGADVRLIQGGVPVYVNHRMQITATVGSGYDNNWYVIDNSPHTSLLDGTTFDYLGYTSALTGWKLIQNSGTSTMTQTTNAGPTGYNAFQLSLASTASGDARATYGDSTSQSSLESTSLFVVPGELYWVSAQLNVAAGNSASLVAVFFSQSGSFVNTVTVANQTILTTGSWKFCEGPVAVPATAAFMVVGVAQVSSTVMVTNLRVRRAS